MLSWTKAIASLRSSRVPSRGNSTAASGRTASCAWSAASKASLKGWRSSCSDSFPSLFSFSLSCGPVPVPVRCASRNSSRSFFARGESQPVSLPSSNTSFISKSFAMRCSIFSELPVAAFIIVSWSSSCWEQR